jgi:hypothetical protein
VTSQNLIEIASASLCSSQLLSLLTRQGANVTASDSAADAITKLEEFRPDVLVADIAMPGEDGYSLIHKVRARPRDRRRTNPRDCAHGVRGRCKPETRAGGWLSDTHDETRESVRAASDNRPSGAWNRFMSNTTPHQMKKAAARERAPKPGNGGN